MMQRRDRWGSVVLFSVLAWLPLHAETAARTNQAVISYNTRPMDFESDERSEVLFQRFLEEITSSESIIFDRFTGPASRLAWARAENALGYASLEQFNSDGARLFKNIGLDGLRTAAFAALPLDRWEDYWQGRFLDFVGGTIGNPEEEHIQLTATSYSAVRSSWERSNERGAIQWGARPWRTSPYVYFLANAGRMDGRRLMTFEGRGGYTMFGATKIEARLSLQLPDSWRLAVAGSIDPTKMGASGSPDSTHYGIMLERMLRAPAFGSEGVFYLGFRSGQSGATSNPRHENILVAGLSRGW